MVPLVSLYSHLPLPRYPGLVVYLLHESEDPSLIGGYWGGVGLFLFVCLFLFFMNVTTIDKAGMALPHTQVFCAGGFFCFSL